MPIATAGPHEAEVTLHHREGHRVPVHGRVTSIRDDDGNIPGAVEIYSDNTAQIRQRLRMVDLERQSMRNALTVVANRRSLEINIASRLQEMHRYGHRFALLFMDTNPFKSVNDTYGHDVGDQVLKMMETLVKRADELMCPSKRAGRNRVTLG